MPDSVQNEDLVFHVEHRRLQVGGPRALGGGSNVSRETSEQRKTRSRISTLRSRRSGQNYLA